MANTNQTPISISAPDLLEINASIQALHTKLLPYLVKLSPTERKDLPKMGNKTISFVMKSMEYCGKNPDLVPPFLDVDALTKNYLSYEQLRALYQPLLQVTEALSDSMILSGNKCLTATLVFYNYVKNAVKSKIQKAETIYNDLSARFPGRPKKESAPVVQI